MLNTALCMQLHTRRVHPAFQNLFPSAALLSTNLEVFFQHLHYVSVVQNTLSHMETGLLELFSSQLQREPKGLLHMGCTEEQEHQLARLH